MSKTFEPVTFDLEQLARELLEFRSLLDGTVELSEAEDILPFFRDRPQLATQVAALNLPHEIDCYCHEFDLFGNYRCDLAVGDTAGRAYALIEFEDARPESVFASGDRYNPSWGRRFERGFSQLVDWFWLIDRYRDNVDFRRRFGDGHIVFHGILVIGRNRFLTAEQRDRLAWRLDRVSINTHKVSCITFDDLYRFLNKRLQFFTGLTGGTG